MIKNLGQVAAIYVGKTAPRNANMIWLDNTVVPYVFKAYNGIEWAEIPTGAWIEAYVNGWLVSLQQGTVTADDDYMLINSGGVNYKMTVKDFVKSSVGNPLDFKGVIRTDSDFPNPSTLESGDMYIIITDPAGGTVTDPYSKKTFSDSEKIVWDSVVNSWESLGKIDVSVDLSTTYSATEVTIHSSAGKETTVVGVTDDNAGVMVPVQKKWLDALSNGSTLTPQGPSTAPYHKHRYMDIVDRIISQQSTGDSTTNPMSQKATTDALELKLDKDAVVQVSGVATDKIMSQKAVTDAISTAIGNVDLSDYLPLAGGEMTGSITLPTGTSIKGKLGNGSVDLLTVSGGGITTIGHSGNNINLITGDFNLSHTKIIDGVRNIYKIWDESNLTNPVQTSDLADYVVKSDLDAYATKTWIGEQGYIVESDLASYATQQWVEDKGYLTEASLDTYAKKTDLDSYLPLAGGTMTGAINSTTSNIFSIDSKAFISHDKSANYINIGGYNLNARLFFLTSQSDLLHYRKDTDALSGTSYKIYDAYNLPNPVQTSDLNSYATKTWVGEQGYLTSASLSSYATQKWVQDQEYITGADIPPIVIVNSGDGNAVTSIKATGHALSVTKGATYLTSSDLTGYATEAWVEGKNYLTSADLSTYATQKWVQDQNYITSSSLTDYATKTWVEEKNYLVASDLNGYATESWVESKNYITSVALTGYATEEWVEAKNYITAGDIPSITITNSGNGNAVTAITANGHVLTVTKGATYLTSASLTGYATEKWVKEQGYLTDDSLTGYATESWVEGKGYLTSTDLASYATQDWVKQQGYLTDAGLDDYAKKTDLSSYLPLAGGTTTGDIVIGNGFALKGNYTTGTADVNLISSTVGLNPKINVGSISTRMILQTNANAISHLRGTTSYDVWDAYNLPNPVQTSDLESYATKTWVGEQGYLTSDSLSSYATQKWVEDKGYLTSASLNGYATESWVEAKNYLTSSSLTGYATQAWVQQQNYLTSASLSGYATESWVESKNYLTSASLDGYAKTTDLASYLPLAGGSVTGSILLANSNVALRATLGSTNLHLVSITSAGVTLLGNNSYGMSLTTSNTDLIHVKGGSSYKIYDASNLIDPATMQWVDEQGYITTDALSGYAKTSDLDNYAKTTDLSKYLPLSGNRIITPITGNIFISNNVALKWGIVGEQAADVLKVDSSNILQIGSGADIAGLKIHGSSDLIHTKGSADYKLWDASNVSKPVSYNEGTESAVTTIYNRNLGVNGNQWTFLSSTNASTTNIYAPTTAGTSGQVLQSQGAGKAPAWVDFSGGGVQLNDDNVWTGLNTFQGGLKTSDGTTSYDVWANDILTNPTKYASNSAGSGYALSYYTKTAGWKEIDTLSIDYLTPGKIVALDSGGNGYLGLGTNAYASASIFDINTHALYFDGSTTKVLNANSSGVLEYGSNTNYGDFNSRNIRIAYPFASGGGGGGSSTTYEGGLTIGYYPTNRKSSVTERAKIYCTTDNLYLKDIAKNTQLDFDTDGLYVTTGSTSKVRLATLNDVSGGGGSSVSLDGNNTWTGNNTFGKINIYSDNPTQKFIVDPSSTYLQLQSFQPTSDKSYFEIALGDNKIATNNVRFGNSNVSGEDPYGYIYISNDASGLTKTEFKFNKSGSLTTTVNGTEYEFWNKKDLPTTVSYNSDSATLSVVPKKQGEINTVEYLTLSGLVAANNITLSKGGNGEIGTEDAAFNSAYISDIYAANVTTTNIVVPGSENYFEFKEDGLYFYDIVNQEEYKINMTKI